MKKPIIYRKNENWDILVFEKDEDFTKKNIEEKFEKYCDKHCVEKREQSIDIIEHFVHNGKVHVCFAII